MRSFLISSNVSEPYLFNLQVRPNNQDIVFVHIKTSKVFRLQDRENSAKSAESLNMQ